MQWWHQRTQLFSLLIPSPCPSPWSDPHSCCCTSSPSVPGQIPQHQQWGVLDCWPSPVQCLIGKSVLDMTKPNLPFKSMVLDVITWNQEKNPQENSHNSTVCASAQSGERQAPVMIILWDSIVFGIQTVVWSAFQESLSKTRKGFQSKRKKWQKLGVKTHLV